MVSEQDEVVETVVVKSVTEQPVAVTVVDGEQVEVVIVELFNTVEVGSQRNVTWSAVASEQDEVVLIVVVKSLTEQPVVVAVVEGEHVVVDTVELSEMNEVGSQRTVTS